MLELAIKARIPLIAVHTDDPLNVEMILQHYCGDDELERARLGRANLSTHGSTLTITPGGIFYTIGSTMPLDLLSEYAALAEVGACLIIVNPDDIHPAMYDAGTLHVPDSVISDFVRRYSSDAKEHYPLEAALRGLSFKEISEVSKLAMTSFGEFTADSVLRIRRQRTALANGLQFVDTEQVYYAPPLALGRWLSTDGLLFKRNVDRILRPRGLLFSGPPGTGKTSGAKHLAHTLGVPLYRLDVGSTMQKYVGESERTFATALAQVERLAPCVLLLDEVEKAFGRQDDSGVSSRVLGLLLWWLQEHDRQVLTVMTTNDDDALPPELVRPGRVDSAIEFRGLTPEEGREFAQHLRTALQHLGTPKRASIEYAVKSIYAHKLSTERVPQAVITQTVINVLKAQLVKESKECC